LRRPSLDEVFFALTTENTGDTSAARVEAGEPERGSGGRHSLERNGDTSAAHVEAEEPGRASGRHRLENAGNRSATPVDAEALW
jgi:hypothetical protein